MLFVDRVFFFFFNSDVSVFYGSLVVGLNEGIRSGILVFIVVEA